MECLNTPVYGIWNFFHFLFILSFVPSNSCVSQGDGDFTLIIVVPQKFLNMVIFVSLYFFSNMVVLNSSTFRLPSHHLLNRCVPFRFRIYSYISSTHWVKRTVLRVFQVLTHFHLHFNPVFLPSTFFFFVFLTNCQNSGLFRVL